MINWLTSIGKQNIDFSYLTKELVHPIYCQGNINNDRAKFYLFLGDLHGNIKAAIILAIRLQIIFKQSLKAIFQVGDFGFYPTGKIAQTEDPYYKNEDSLDFFELKNATNISNYFSLGQERLENLQASFFFIRGNHEDFERLDLISKSFPSEVLTGIYFIPDYYQGNLEGLNVLALGGILTDLERGRGKKAKIQFKKAQQKVKIDRRRSEILRLIQTEPTEIDLLLTHSGLISRENHDGSQQLETYLSKSNISIHFYGHHHRFSIGHTGAKTLSIGLRNLEIEQTDRLRAGSFALVAWNDKNNFEIYSDFQTRD